MLTEAQLAERKGKITSSIVAACLGLDPRKSRIQAALEARGDVKPKPRTRAMERGDLLEDVVLSYPADKFGWQWKRPEFRSREPWAGDSCDAVYYSDGELIAIGEGKTAALGMSKHFGEEETDDIPESALCQSHWHLWHWPEVNTCWVPVLKGGFDFSFALYKVTRDDDLIQSMVAECHEFWEMYVNGTNVPPPTDLDHEWLEQRWTQGVNWAPDSGDLCYWALAKDKAARIRKQAAKDEETAKAHLKAILGEAQGCRAEWGNVYWRAPKSIYKTNWQAIATELAGGDVPEDLFARHSGLVKPHRRLSVHLKGEIDE